MRSGEIGTLLDAGDRAAAGRALNAALTHLHESDEARELCALHLLAVRYWQDDAAQVAFHRTHAYVYALEAGDEIATRDLHAALEAEGRI